MTANRPNLLTMSGFVLVATLLVAAAISPILDVAARVVA